MNLQHSTISVIRENAADGACAYQILDGLRANVSDHVFLVTGYKYFVANYQWEKRACKRRARPLVYPELSHAHHFRRFRVPLLNPLSNRIASAPRARTSSQPLPVRRSRHPGVLLHSHSDPIVQVRIDLENLWWGAKSDPHLLAA